MTDNIDIVKLAPTLSGTERAKLIIKDNHQRPRGGFLTEADRIALLTIRDSQTKEELDKCVRIYYSVGDVMHSLKKAYLSFRLSYYELAEIRYRLSLSEALLKIKRALVNKIARCIMTEDEYAKEKHDAINKTISIEEVVNIETALSLVQQGKTTDEDIMPYDTFDMSKSPFRCADPTQDEELKKLFLEEQGKQETKITEAIASGKLKADGNKIRTQDWERYPDKMDDYTTSALGGYRLIIKIEDDDPYFKAQETKLKPLLEHYGDFVESIQPIDTNGQDIVAVDKASYKRDVALIMREIVPRLRKDSSEFFTLVCIADRISQELGFDPFYFDTKPSINNQTTLDYIVSDIKSHNSIILGSRPRDEAKEIWARACNGEKEPCYYKELENLDDYLIPEPTVNAELYAKWERWIFGLNSS